jgi:hypothetical protein
MPTVEQRELFAVEPSLPAGFAYRDALITPAEEDALLRQFEHLPFEPFDFHGFLGKRRVVSFGYSYDYASAALRDSDPIPAFLFPLRARAAAFAGVPVESLQQILINEYAPGAGIGWHREADVQRRRRGLTVGAEHSAASPQAGKRVGTRLTSPVTAFGLPSARRSALGMATQRPARRCTALLGHIPEFRERRSPRSNQQVWLRQTRRRWS